MQRETIIAKVLKDKRGATAIEYGMLVGLLAMAILVGMDGFASQVEAMWHKVETGLR